MNIAVLGAGLVGKHIALDLSNDKNYHITSIDINSTNLEFLKKQNINTLLCDVSDSEKLHRELTNFEIVVNAVPGFLGFNSLIEIIKCGKNVVDIAFYDNDPFELRDLAISKNVTAIVDCGVSPGLSNLLIGYAASLLDELKTVKIYVGGLPEKKDGLYDYKAVFSPTDVLEEYTRSARVIENGSQIIKPPLSEIEKIEFDRIGVLEAFNSDGLRTLLKTVNAENMVEKTLRYPGHANKMKLLSDSGFLDKKEILVKGVKVSPFYFTAEMLKRKWKFIESDYDITVLRVIVEGSKDGQRIKYQYDLFDDYDKKNNVHSMARTTGYTASTFVRMMAKDMFQKRGVFPPEFFGTNSQIKSYIIQGLETKGIIVQEKKIALN